MKVTIDLKYLTLTVLSFVLAFLMMRGTVQEYIPFEAPLNEMAFTVGCLMFGFLCLICTPIKNKKEAK